MDKITKLLKRADATNWPEIAKQAMRNFYRDSDCDLKITIQEDKDTRSVKQNRLLFKWHSEFKSHIYGAMSQEYSTEDIHDYVIGILLPKRIVTMFGEPEVKRALTSGLKVKPFCELLLKYEIWAAEKYQCTFTQPPDLYFDALMMQMDSSDCTGDGM